MEKFEIIAEKREVTGKKVGALRRQGKLPGVIYGHKFDSVPVLMELKETTRILNKATSSSVINILLDGKSISALIREKQRDYLKNRYLHVDFQSVSLTEKIRAEVNIEFTGIAPAVKEYSGVIVEGLTSVEVEALPTDLPERFIVDISSLVEIGDSLLVKDIQIPEGVEFLTSLDEMVILVTSPAAEIEEEEEVEDELSEPEVIEKGKADEDGEEDEEK